MDPDCPEWNPAQGTKGIQVVNAGGGPASPGRMGAWRVTPQAHKRKWAT